MRMPWTGVLLSLVVLAACASEEGTRPGVDLSQGNATSSSQVRRQVDEMRFLHGQALLSRMEWLASRGDEAVPAITEGASSDDSLVRASCMWILERMGDRRNVPVVAERLTDPVAVVRYQAAGSLVKLGDPRGFRVLVEGLADGDIKNRYKCFQALQLATGRDFGYRHDADPEERRQAVGRWLDWLEGVQAKAL